MKKPPTHSAAADQPPQPPQSAQSGSIDLAIQSMTFAAQLSSSPAAVAGAQAEPTPETDDRSTARLPSGRKIIVQSGVVPFRVDPAGRVWFMLITNRRGDWIVPKGMIQSTMTPEQSALNEALEEAGILGAVTGPSIGAYTVMKSDLLCRVDLFAMRVERTLPRWLEQDERERDWFSADDAVERVHSAELRRVITALARTLANAARHELDTRSTDQSYRAA